MPEVPAVPRVAELTDAAVEAFASDGPIAAALEGFEPFRFEYGLALVKTAAAQCYTIQLAHHLQVTTVTDSPAHFQLFGRSLDRENERLPNHLVIRTWY